jgi:hypothetical protein
MNPALQPAKDGRGGDSELLGGLADGEQFAVGRVVGRLVGGDSAVAAQAAGDDLGEALTGRGAAPWRLRIPAMVASS